MTKIEITHRLPNAVKLDNLTDLEVYSAVVEALLTCCGRETENGTEHEVQGVFDDGEMGAKAFNVTKVDASVPGTLVVYDGDRPTFTVHIIEVK